MRRVENSPWRGVPADVGADPCVCPFNTGEHTGSPLQSQTGRAHYQNCGDSLSSTHVRALNPRCDRRRHAFLFAEGCCAETTTATITDNPRPVQTAARIVVRAGIISGLEPWPGFRCEPSILRANRALVSCVSRWPLPTDGSPLFSRPDGVRHAATPACASDAHDSTTPNANTIVTIN